ncbi:MAG: GPW/gp25 family protein [Bacteroidetes bacterium]|jgi:phage baseplate assembly protein W|nr:MAG: GPW/gp25 family protein [Bacteroidota bacterium]
MNVENSFLGTGWSFPPAFDKTSGTVKMVSNEEDIAQSLQILLSTRPGERVMLPQYGCNLDVFMFESITTTLVAYVKELIQTAILYFEPRINLDLITINTDSIVEGVILIELEYTIRASNSRFNLVYPFYLNESAVA